jgi:hypothetical protein
MVRYAALLHRLHPERASEQGLRAYDSVAAPTSAAEITRTVRPCTSCAQAAVGVSECVSVFVCV